MDLCVWFFWGCENYGDCFTLANETTGAEKRHIQYFIIWKYSIHLIHLVFLRTNQAFRVRLLVSSSFVFLFTFFAMMKMELNLPCNITMIRAQIVTETNNTDRMTIDVAIFLSIDFNWRKCYIKSKNIKNCLTLFRCPGQSTRSNINIIYGFLFLYANIRHTINKHNNVVCCGVVCELYIVLCYIFCYSPFQFVHIMYWLCLNKMIGIILHASHAFT